MSTQAIRLYVATSNAGKLRDFEFAAECVSASQTPMHVELLVLPGLCDIAPPDENQTTFSGNARLKACYYSRFLPGRIVLADDSGLEVDALGGAPGVRSARYAEDRNFQGVPHLDLDTRNNLCLLEALAGVGDLHLKARYRCVLAAAQDGVFLAEASGALEGRIETVPKGQGGFGYDPYFVPEGTDRSMAMLTSPERLQLSHRGKALRALLQDVDHISKPVLLR